MAASHLRWQPFGTIRYLILLSTEQLDQGKVKKSASVIGDAQTIRAATLIYSSAKSVSMATCSS